MPSPTTLGPRIRTNIPSQQAYDALFKTSSEIAQSQLRLSSGRRINAASDDVSGFITSRSLISRNSSLRSSLLSAGEALNVTAIANDSFDNIHGLLKGIRSSALIASSDSLGTDEKVSLAKAAYRLAQQVQFIVDSTVFGGKQLLQGNFSADWTVGLRGDNGFLEVELDLSSINSDLSQDGSNFNLNSTTNQIFIDSTEVNIFAGVTGLDLENLNDVMESNLGIFNNENIDIFIDQIGEAMNNVAIAGAYVGGIQQRLKSQNQTLLSQITNYDSAISRIDDADIAEEQLNLLKNQFLQKTSLNSLTQANANSLDYFRLFV